MAGYDDLWQVWGKIRLLGGSLFVYAFVFVFCIFIIIWFNEIRARPVGVWQIPLLCFLYLCRYTSLSRCKKVELGEQLLAVCLYFDDFSNETV